TRRVFSTKRRNHRLGAALLKPRSRSARVKRRRLCSVPLRFVDVDAYQGERSVFQPRNERPLVGPTGPSGQSDVLPEIEGHDLGAVVAQLEANAVLANRAEDPGLWSVGKAARVLHHLFR